MDLGAGRGDGRCASIRPGQAERPMARGDQFLDDGQTDESGRAGDEDTHRNFSLLQSVAATASQAGMNEVGD
jgi:hypothetical protein